MTDDMMNLRALVEKTPDSDLLREMIGFAAERLMALEVGAATGPACGKKKAYARRRLGPSQRPQIAHFRDRQPAFFYVRITSAWR